MIIINCMEISQKEETDKLYYSISEVSQMFELNASTLRFWEKEFEVLNPIKNKKGNRLFTKKDIEHLFGRDGCWKKFVYVSSCCIPSVEGIECSLYNS